MLCRSHGLEPHAPAPAPRPDATAAGGQRIASAAAADRAAMRRQRASAAIATAEAPASTAGASADARGVDAVWNTQFSRAWQEAEAQRAADRRKDEEEWEADRRRYRRGGLAALFLYCWFLVVYLWPRLLQSFPLLKPLGDQPWGLALSLCSLVACLWGLLSAL